MKIISFNMNGIRAAHRKGFYDWVQTLDADHICVQETKAQMNDGLKDTLKLAGYQGYFSDASKKGYSGVGIFTKQQPKQVIDTIGMEIMDDEGRFIQLDFLDYKVTSLYLPSGTSGQARQDIKMQILDWFHENYLQPQLHNQLPQIICGDWNIAHKPEDLKNWRQNQKNSGFLPEERAWLDQLFEQTGWVDAYRVLHTDKTEYTWWSYRGQSRKNNTGWRIDYQVITPNLRSCVVAAEVMKDPVFSDHAPLMVTYQMSQLGDKGKK